MPNINRGRIPSELGSLIDELDNIERRLRILEAPSGEALASNVAKLEALIVDIQAQLDAWTASRWTNAQIVAAIQSPGNIAPGDVTAAGTVSGNYGGDFPAGLRSTGAYSTLVTGGGAYVAAWIHNDGRIGHAPSSRRFKTDIEEPTFSLDNLARLPGFFFRYWADPPYAQEAQRLNFGIMAEDAHKAGFEWMVIYDDDGKPFSIRPEAVAAVALEGVRMLTSEIAAIRADVATLKGETPTVQGE